MNEWVAMRTGRTGGRQGAGEGGFQTSDFSAEEEERCRRRYKAIAREERSNHGVIIIIHGSFE